MVHLISEDRKQRTDDGGQRSEDRKQRSDDGGQWSESRGQKLEFGLRPLRAVGSIYEQEAAGAIGAYAPEGMMMSELQVKNSQSDPTSSD